MIATTEIIAALQSRLVAAFPDLAVELYPPQPATYRLNHPSGALLIACPGASYGEHLLRGNGGSQQRTLSIGITLATRHLWGDLGAPALLDRLRLALSGWLPTPEAVTPVIAISERLVNEDAGIWWHAAQYQTTYRETFDALSS
jgi:hypothetical protein